MLDLTRNERSAVILLLALLMTGLGVSWYGKVKPCARVEIDSFEVGKLEAEVQARGRININEATAADFEKLEGVGSALAGRIIAMRESKGRFGSIEELKEVKGIGDKLFDKIKERVSAE